MSGGYRSLHLLVEGQTEETVVSTVLRPYLTGLGWSVSVSLVKTKRPAGGPSFKGGISTWKQVETDVRLLLGNSSLTRLFDFYGLPADFPGMQNLPTGDPYTRVAHVEQQFAAAIGDQRFVPHLVLHELEAWVFAASDQLGLLHGPDIAQKLKEDEERAGGPELVNDGPTTAPSKRILRYCPGYMKTSDGPMAIEELGVAALRARCPHLDEWLTSLA
ncbi:hypothetical protein BBK82_09425 [Lentzea guizhouensis]|uniref:DUF4276 domain-containing protein n=1 Tax=Lentzea guizhouensis TaxID=1586287 RepID=A0A1B2HEY1_9PSEU|nr:DUF4276 family protein [Lentzea guizhouensis]ANZ36250.1 hypothetical protein BBK82_09425 [Lentzea guizhouensis]